MGYSQNMRGGQFRGHRGRYRGGRGRVQQKDKHEISAVHNKLLQSIKALSLEEVRRGAQPLRSWTDTNTDSEFLEVRFKRGQAYKVKENGVKLQGKDRTFVSIESLKEMELKKNHDPDQWLEGIPKGSDEMKLTFK